MFEPHARTEVAMTKAGVNYFFVIFGAAFLVATVTGGYASDILFIFFISYKLFKGPSQSVSL